MSASIVAGGLLLACGCAFADGGRGGGGHAMGAMRSGGFGHRGAWGGSRGHPAAWGGWHGHGPWTGGRGWGGWYVGYYGCCGWGLGFYFYDPLWDAYPMNGYVPEDGADAFAAPAFGEYFPLPPTVWYYCPDSQSYYPNVQQCASAWQPVSAAPDQ